MFFNKGVFWNRVLSSWILLVFKVLQVLELAKNCIPCDIYLKMFPKFLRLKSSISLEGILTLFLGNLNN